MSRRTKITRLASVAAVAALAISGCSGDRGSDPSGAGGQANIKGAGSGEKFGELDSPCGSGKEGAKGFATDTGVTEDKIMIGYGDDKGNSVLPGLNEDMGDAVKAMIDWCNDQGGINGRQIEGHRYDAKLFQTQAVISEACQQDFFLVGQGFAGQDGTEADRVRCNLPQVAGIAVGSNISNAPMSYLALPYPVDYINMAGLRLLQQNEADVVKSDLGVVDTQLPVVKNANRRWADGANQTVNKQAKTCGQELPAQGVANPVEVARAYRECGVSLFYTGRPNDQGTISLMENLKEPGFKWLAESNWYTEDVTTANTDGVFDGMRVQISTEMLDSDKPAVKKYNELLDKSGGKKGMLGMQATSSFLLWAQAAQECGSDLTRQCVINKLAKVDKWTGGGLHAESNPGGNLPAKCAQVLEIQGQSFKKLYPSGDGMYCDDQNLIKLSQSVWGTNLNDDRIADEFATPNMITPKE